jgi:UDP-2,4-diacetamido-2,4,6-trideoxy-beta-L-altropyranose hydrolase
LKSITKRYKNILFRADSSSQIGLGHIMRDIVLAKQFKDANITFACQNLKGNIIDKIPYKTIILKSDDIDELIKLIKEKDIELLVIDHYGINHEDEKRIKKESDVTILSFDDSYEKHYCDILLNQSIHASSEKYKTLVQNNTKLLCGKKYILIDEVFYNIKNSINKADEGYILLTLGGGDISSVIENVINFLIKIDNTLKVIIISPQYKKLSKNTLNIIKNYDFTILPKTDKMPQVINGANLVICSLGMVTYEVIFLNKKILPIKTASNQNSIASYFAENNIDFLNSDDLEDITSFKNSFCRLLKSSNINYDKDMINPIQNSIVKSIF